MRVTLTSLATVLVMSATAMSAGVPNVMNYQGRLTDAAGDPVADGAYLVKFIIYDAATGGTVLWNSLFQTVNTVGGVFSYDLGANVALPDLFGADSIRYLGITVGTDPEISPRSRFRSSGYVFRSQKSELALDADSLGGLQPSFYLDWANQTGVPAGFADNVDDTASSIDWTALTSVPAGFADGVDDEGISQAAADGRYVNLTGDVMTGDLNLQAAGVDQITLDADNGTGINLFQGGTGNRTARLWGPAVGELQLWDNQNPPVNTVDIFASNNGGELHLRNISGINAIRMRGNLSGNSSVILPDDAISSSEMLDEPGITTNTSSTSIVLATGTSVMVDILTVTITIPNAGYIMLGAQCYMNISGSTGGASGIIQIDQTIGGGILSPYYNYAGFEGGYGNTGPHIFPMNTSRVYFKNSGTYTFRVEARRFSSSGTVRVTNARLTAVYYPTAYGAITAVAEQPGDHPNAREITITDLNGSTQTAYEMDLRYYEDKARAARIAKQKAELAEADAELELVNARAKSSEIED